MDTEVVFFLNSITAKQIQTAGTVFWTLLNPALPLQVASETEHLFLEQLIQATSDFRNEVQ